MKNNELEILMQFPRIIYMIMRKIMRGFHFSQYGLELNQTQRRTLLILLNKGASSMTQLHDLVGLEKGSLTTVVDQLIAKTLVERRRNTRDRRKLDISLTSTGVKKAAILRKEIAGHVKRRLDRLTENDRRQFYQAVAILDDIMPKL
jgi:MarR family transcriptional regulator, organic hydroperoxide resistance regulator